MRDKFVEVKNVKKFDAVMDRVDHVRLKGMCQMALVFGAPGLGKTETALRYAANNGALYIRMKKLMNARWFLRELTYALGSSPAWRTEELLNHLIDLLQRRNRVLILDEVDYFTSDSKVTETLRDIYDMTGTPMLFIGMSQADKRLMRYPHLYDRFVEVLEFQPLDRQDVELMVRDLCDVTFDGTAIDKIAAKSEGKTRRIMALIHRAEQIAARNRLKSVSAKEIG